MAKTTRRRGRGAIYPYDTKAGTRWRWQIYAPSDPNEPDGDQKRVSGGGYKTDDDADDALQVALQNVKNQRRAVSSGAPLLGPYAQEWLDSQRLAPSTMAGYRRLVRLYIEPQLSGKRLTDLTPMRISRHYVELLKSGGQEGRPISANTVRKTHVVLGSILDAAIDDGHLVTNPARRSRLVNAPTGKQVRAEAPEMVTWSTDELKRFLTWDRDVYEDEHYALWVVLAHTGMRRSEALALRWNDVEVKNQRIAIRRAADTINHGAVKTTKNGSARVVDVDETVIDVLKAWKAARGSLSLSLARAESYIFGSDEGSVINPNRATNWWLGRVSAMRRQLGDDAITPLSLHGLRHTHATLLLSAGVHPKVVQERLGHSDISVTMSVYSHVTPTMQREAVDRLAAMFSGA